MEAKQVADMMEAYASIYEKSEERVIDEGLQGAVEKGLDAAAKNPVIKAIGKAIAPVGKGRKTPTKTSGGYRPVVKEGVESDLFDVILEYLVSEGYADTNKNALVIMANMSEEWKKNIVEQMTGGSTDSPSDENKSFTGEGPKKPKEWKPTGPKLKSGQRPGYAR